MEALDTVNEERRVHSKTITASQKAKHLCESRWVERHTVLEDFATMYEAVVDCVTAIFDSDSHRRDSKAITEENGLLNSITSPQFLAAFQINISVFSYTKGLSELLQGSSQDVILVYNEVGQ